MDKHHNFRDPWSFSNADVDETNTAGGSKQTESNTYGTKSSPYLLTEEWQRWLTFFLLGIGFAVIGVIALSIVYGILEARDVRRFRATRNDINQLRESVGFYTYKSGIQDVVANTYVTIANWSAVDNAPFYDSSNGAMDFNTGIWTTQVPGKYQVSGVVCWTSSGSLNTRQMLFLTNGTSPSAPFTATVAYGQTCTSMSVPMNLPKYMTVQILAYRSTAGSEVVQSLLTSFGMELIARS